MKTIEFKAIAFDTPCEAMQWADAEGRDRVVRLNGCNYVMDEAEADRLASLGVEFAYMCDHRMPDGSYRIIHVPVN